MSDVFRGEIYTANIPMPSTFSNKFKVRPVLIIQSDTLNQRRDDIIVVAISSNMKRAADSGNHVFSDYASLNLKVKSVVMCSSILTIPKALLRHRLGQVSEPEMKDISQKINRCIS